MTRRHSPQAARSLAWGVVAIVGYLASALATFTWDPLPVRPLYDGAAPPAPYQWVNPPPRFAAGNVPPKTSEFPTPADGPVDLSSEDGQVTLSILPGGIARRDGEDTVIVRLVPLDPETVGKPPQGRVYDGNAYLIEARYANSGAPLEIAAPCGTADTGPRRCVTVVLRYATGAAAIVQRQGDAWLDVPSTPFHQSLLIAGETDTLGTFAAVAMEGIKSARSKSGIYIGAVLGAAALGAALGYRRRRGGASKRPRRSLGKRWRSLKRALRR